MRIECDRCGKVQMVNETHTPQRAMQIRDILAKMRHDGCGGRAGKVELITGIEGASSRPGGLRRTWGRDGAPRCRDRSQARSCARWAVNIASAVSSRSSAV
jgi:hypothetical protein